MADHYGYGNHIVVSMERAGAALRQILDVVTNEVRMGVNAGVKQTAKETAKITRESGGYSDTSTNRGGKYRKSITYRFNTRGITCEAQIYASGHEYSLTHLLENGHHLWNKPGVMTGSFKHWKTGEEYADAHVAQNILKNIKF
ncbi:hypothetical protein [Faecalibaculum rodentium]|uniref:hypothetical protein n=2 Tax=Faecalibaculum rodentium TaxID=1702221 RepID=UPI002729FF81|nr:hypothetical protein [Faecalibaculum rodentium]